VARRPCPPYSRTKKSSPEITFAGKRFGWFVIAIYVPAPAVEAKLTEQRKFVLWWDGQEKGQGAALLLRITKIQPRLEIM